MLRVIFASPWDFEVSSFNCKLKKTNVEFVLILVMKANMKTTNKIFYIENKAGVKACDRRQL